jgi:hypothetical protein
MSLHEKFREGSGKVQGRFRDGSGKVQGRSPDESAREECPPSDVNLAERRGKL